MSDANVEAVLKKLRDREETGLRKYGVTTERLDLQTIDWLRHAQEEAMDLCVYLERLISDIERNPYDSSALRESLHRSANRCPYCDGSGLKWQFGFWKWILAENLIHCPACKGTGQRNGGLPTTRS